MKKLLHSFVVLVLFTSLNLWSQTGGPNVTQYKIEEQWLLESQDTSHDSLLVLKEKVFVHLADNTVQNKGTLFFKAYLVAGPQKLRSDLSKVLRVELIDEDGAVIKRQHHPITGGMSSGNMIIPKKLESGNYYLQAYTRWMQNYGEASYAKKIVYVGNRNDYKVPEEGRSLEVQVFSEGGNLVNDLKNRLVLKLESTESSAEVNSGEIIDQHWKGSAIRYS